MTETSKGFIWVVVDGKFGRKSWIIFISIQYRYVTDNGRWSKGEIIVCGSRLSHAYLLNRASSRRKVEEERKKKHRGQPFFEPPPPPHDLSSIDRGRRRLARYRYLIHPFRGLMDIERRWRTRESSPLSGAVAQFTFFPTSPLPPERGSRKRDTEITRRVPRGTMDVTRDSWRGRERWEGRTFVKSGADRVTSIIRSTCYGENICLNVGTENFSIQFTNFLVVEIIVFAVGKARDLLFYRRVRKIRVQSFDFSKNFG